MKILIVGGVAGGASAAARLRRLDEHARIVMLERGGYVSFANCGLPYYIGGEITDESELVLQTPEGFRARFNVDVRIHHEAAAIDTAAKTVAVRRLDTGETYTETYDKLLLSPGAEPVLPWAALKSDRIFTLRSIPDTFKIKRFIGARAPKRAVVVGGGYIGVEMAENLRNAGLDVTVVELADQVIAPLDYDMACDLHGHMARKGVRLLLSQAVKDVAQDGEGLAVTLESGVLRADMLVSAVGVRAESALARDAGLALNARGGIVTDARMRTSDEHIYAVGDATEGVDFVTGQRGMVPLAGPANKQGRVAADNICGIPSVFDGTQGTAIIRVFDMTAAVTGVNEKTAARLGLRYDKSYTYSASHAGYYPGAKNMSVKVLFDPESGRLLGAQIVGFDGVDKRCDVLATAIRAGMTAYDLTKLELCYAPPYSSAKDPVNMAGFVIENILTGKVKTFHWHEADALPRDGSVQLLDTRTPGEYKRGTIDGFVNFPVDELRARLGELDKSRPVYLTCQVGLRGYIAARILSQHGFDVYNLSGGYRLYASIFGGKAPPDGIGVSQGKK